MGNTEQQSYLYPINEIFFSIQGEGYWSGTAAVFIRLSGCNLRCDFCDTEFLSFSEMSVSDIIQNIKKYPAKHCVITGGEPLMQDTEPLVKALKNEGYFIQVETNGMFSPHHSLFDWITVSPKNSRLQIHQAHEIKVILGKNEIADDYGIQAEHYFISPKNPTHSQAIGENTATTIDMENHRYCADYVLKHPKWHLTLQLHKLLGIQ